MTREWPAFLCFAWLVLASGAPALADDALADDALVDDAPPDDAPPLAKAPFDAGQARSHQQAWAGHIGKPLEYTNSVGMRLRLIPPGEFMMGRTEQQYERVLQAGREAGLKPAQAATWEMLMMPAHRVRITKPFYLGATEVTVDQFRKFCEESGYKTEAEQGLHAGKPYKG